MISIKFHFYFFSFNFPQSKYTTKQGIKVVYNLSNLYILFVYKYLLNVLQIIKKSSPFS